VHEGGRSIKTDGSCSSRRRGPAIRRWFGALAAIAALGLPALASADAVSLGIGSEPLHLGSGAGDLLIAGRNAAPLSFHVQLKLLPKLRMEVSAAYFHVARDAAHTPAGGSPYDFTATAAGFGAVYYLAPSAPVGLFVGGRLTVAQYQGNYTDKPLPLNAPKMTKMNFFVAPVVGAEVALTRRLFIGTELQLSIALGGDRSTRTVGSANTPNIGARLSADNIFFARFLLF
jgi:hypothetical protein